VRRTREGTSAGSREVVVSVVVIRPFVAADQPGVGELGEVRLDARRPVFRAQHPQLPGGDRGVVAVAALVVGLGEQTEEGALGGQGHGGQGLGDEGFGLDGADSCQEGWLLTRLQVGRHPRRTVDGRYGRQGWGIGRLAARGAVGRSCFPGGAST
jgi:hypothetical protein